QIRGGPWIDLSDRGGAQVEQEVRVIRGGRLGEADKDLTESEFIGRSSDTLNEIGLQAWHRRHRKVRPDHGQVEFVDDLPAGSQDGGATSGEYIEERIGRVRFLGIP